MGMKRILLSFILFAVAATASKAQTLSLQDCVDMALGDNVSIKNSRLDIMSAKMQKRETLANFFPTVSASAFGFHSLNPLFSIGLDDLLGSSDAANNLKYYLGTEAEMSGISTTYETLQHCYTAGLTLSQPIFAGGRIVNGNRLAALGEKSAAVQDKIARRDITHEVQSKYWQVVSLEEKMEALEHALALADTLAKDAQSALEAGLATDDAADLVNIKRQEILSRRIRLKGGIMLTKMDLCEAMGLESSRAISLKLSDRMPQIDEPSRYWQDPAEIVERMDESSLLDLAVKQKEIEKNMALGEALPQIGLGASYGYGKVFTSARLNGAVYATVKIPLSDWGKTSSKMRRVEYQREKAENDREHLSAMLELKVRKLWVEVESTWEELRLKEESTAYAQKSLMRCKANLSAGLATEGDVMEKQVALLGAQCDEIDAAIAYRNALSEYLCLKD